MFFIDLFTKCYSYVCNIVNPDWLGLEEEEEFRYNSKTDNLTSEVICKQITGVEKDKPKSQQFMQNQFMFLLKNKGNTAKKYKPAYLRRIEAFENGTVKETIVGNEVEQKYTLVEGEYEIWNVCSSSKEKYSTSEKNAKNKYDFNNPVKEFEDDFGVTWICYPPIGEVYYYQVTADDLINIGDLGFETSWKSVQMVKVHDFLVTSYPEVDDIRLIDFYAFNDTYKKNLSNNYDNNTLY